MLLSIDIDRYRYSSYNEQVIPHSYSITTFCMLPFYAPDINKASTKVRLIKIIYISSLTSWMRIILRQSALYVIPPTVSGLLDKSEVCALTNIPLFFSLRGLNMWSRNREHNRHHTRFALWPGRFHT